MPSFLLSDAAHIAESPGVHLKNPVVFSGKSHFLKKPSSANDCGAGTVFFVVAWLRV